MNELVFIEPNKMDSIPFTTSKVISDFSGVEHRKLKNTISKYKNDIESFGLLTSYQAESTGGRPETFYKLNESQATFIMTLLKNTEIVVAFKRELVKSFYLMREELLKRRVYREQLKPVRRGLTDVIQESTKSKWAYKQYTDLAYKAVLGRNAAQIRKERNASKMAKAVDYMTAEEIAAITKMQDRIAMLVEMDMDYQQVKLLLLEKFLAGKVA